MRVLYILLAVLVALVLIAFGAAYEAYGIAPEPLAVRATFTPYPVVTPAPTYTPAYPAPSERKPQTVRDVWPGRFK